LERQDETILPGRVINAIKTISNIANPVYLGSNNLLITHAMLYTGIRDGEKMSKIGLLHPGEMGISIAVSAINNGHQVYWMSRGRSQHTRARAEKQGLIEVDSLFEFSQSCEIIFSICPPHAAEEIAKSVLETKFRGYYLDANAISPQRAIKIGQMMEANDIQFVDGGIIGGPVSKPQETWLYLSGQQAHEITKCFSNGPLETKIIGNEIGKASALKMCYAAYSKGTTALLAAILATAESLGVREELYQQWELDEQGFSEQVDRRVTRVTAKAWRFEGEMKEIAETFQEAGLPEEFHKAAAEIYRRMSIFKDSAETPSLQNVLEILFER
jgi:3-hydroxyisobutyrate dehydrogenase-like beta-hydroxyacid dehydrogenase